MIKEIFDRFPWIERIVLGIRRLFTRSPRQKKTYLGGAKFPEDFGGRNGYY